MPDGKVSFNISRHALGMKQDDVTMPLQPETEEPDRRGGHCLPVTLPGQFIVNGRGSPCTIVDISRNGASITLAADLPDTTECLIARLRIDGLRLFDVRIRWRSEHGIGLSFEKGRLSDAEMAAFSSAG